MQQWNDQETSTTNRPIDRREFLAASTTVGTLTMAGCSGDDGEDSNPAEEYEEVGIRIEYPDPLIRGVDNICTVTIDVHSDDGWWGSNEIHDPKATVDIEGPATISHVMPGDFAADVSQTDTFVSGLGAEAPWTGGETKTAALSVTPSATEPVTVRVAGEGHAGDGNVQTIETSETLAVRDRPAEGLTREDFAREAQRRATIARSYSAMLRGEFDPDIEEQLRRASMDVVLGSGQLAADAIVGEVLGAGSDVVDFVWETLTLFKSPFDIFVNGQPLENTDENVVDEDIFAPPMFSQLLNRASSITDLDQYLRRADKRRTTILLEVIADYAEDEAELWRSESEERGQLLAQLNAQLVMLDAGAVYARPEDVQRALDEKWEELNYGPGEQVDLERHNAVDLLMDLGHSAEDSAEENTILGMGHTLWGLHDHGVRLYNFYENGGLDEGGKGGTTSLTVETLPASEMWTDSLRFTGKVTDIDPSEPGKASEDVIVETSFEYRRKGESEWQETEGNLQTGTGEFESFVSGLEPGTTYEFRARAAVDSEWDVGDVLTATTEKEGNRSEEIVPGPTWPMAQATPQLTAHAAVSGPGESPVLGWVSEVDASLTPPVAVDGTVYAGSKSGTLYAFDAWEGSLQWTETTGGGALFTPAVMNGMAYVTNTSTLYAIDLASESVTWEYTPGVSITSCPIVGEEGITYPPDTDPESRQVLDVTPLGLDAVHFATANGMRTVTEDGDEYIAIDAGIGPALPPAVESQYVVISDHYEPVIYAFDYHIGTRRWKESVTTPPNAPGGLAIDDSVVYAGDFRGKSMVYALDIYSGDPVWPTPFELPHGVQGIAVGPETVYASTFSEAVLSQEGDGSSSPFPQLHAIDRVSGKGRWSTDEAGGRTIPAVTAEQVFAMAEHNELDQDLPNQFLAADHDGTIAWIEEADWFVDGWQTPVDEHFVSRADHIALGEETAFFRDGEGAIRAIGSHEGWVDSE